MKILPGQIPEGLPFPTTTQGVIIMMLVFPIVTLVTYGLTHSRWSWVPGVIFAMIAGAVIH